MSIALPRPDLADGPLADGLNLGGGVEAFALLRGLFSTHWRQLLVTYLLASLENFLVLARPWVLGRAIDGLVQSSYRGLTMFGTLYLFHLLIGSLRRMYDTRAFTGIYTGLATRLVTEQRRQGRDSSCIAARSMLSHEFVDFFERYVPLVIQALCAVLGSLIVLSADYNPILVLSCLALVVPVAVFNVRYARRTLSLSRSLHDQLEAEVEIVSRGGLDAVREHHTKVARWRVLLSDAEALNFGLTEVFVMASISVALVCTCRMPGMTAGDVLAVLGYVQTFVGGLDGVPLLVQQASRLRDIGRRL
jgi:hypothetical protein